MIFNKYRVAFSIVLMIVLSDCKTNQKTIINSHQNSQKSLFSSTKKVIAVGYSAVSSEAARTGKIWINGYIENFDFEIIENAHYQFLVRGIGVEKRETVLYVNFINIVFAQLKQIAEEIL